MPRVHEGLLFFSTLFLDLAYSRARSYILALFPVFIRAAVLERYENAITAGFVTARRTHEREGAEVGGKWEGGNGRAKLAMISSSSNKYINCEKLRSVTFTSRQPSPASTHQRVRHRHVRQRQLQRLTSFNGWINVRAAPFVDDA